MAEHLAGAKSDFLVQNASKEGLGLQCALHIHIRFPVMNQLDSGQCCLIHIRLMDDADAVLVQIPADLSGNLTDLRLITDQNRLCDSSLLRLKNSFHNRKVLCRRNRQLLGGDFLHLCQDVFKRCAHCITSIHLCLPSMKSAIGSVQHSVSRFRPVPLPFSIRVSL